MPACLKVVLFVIMKLRFIKNQQASGSLSSLRIRTPSINGSLIGDTLF